MGNFPAPWGGEIHSAGWVNIQSAPTTLVEFDGLQAPVSFWVGEGRLSKAADGTFTANDAAFAIAETVDGDYLPVSDVGMEHGNLMLERLPQTALDGIRAMEAGLAGEAGEEGKQGKVVRCLPGRQVRHQCIDQP